MCRVAKKRYLFADESGNFDFRWHEQFAGATRYFAVGTLFSEGEESMRALRHDLMDLRYTLAENGAPVSGAFHATEDQQAVRDAVFAVLGQHDFKVDVTLLEKAKAQPHIRRNDPRFYQYAWFYHFKHFASRYFQPDDQLLVVSAALGTKRTRAAFREAVEDVVTQVCNYRVNKRFGHWDTASDPCLQAVDYVLWAVMRDIERGDPRSRELIEDKIYSVFDLWRVGRTYYYGPRSKNR
jgi:hypothetical protein